MKVVEKLQRFFRSDPAKFQLGPLQKKWIRLLKKGKISQGRGYLRTPEGYCCLGVAHEFVLGKHLPSCGSPETLYDSDTERLGLWNGNGTFKQWDKTESSHKISYILDDSSGREYSSLTEMNDEGVTFPEIARIIEKNPELVFRESL